MNKNQLISAFSDPTVLHSLDLETIEELVEQFPVSAMLRMIYVKRLKDEDDIRFEGQLKLAAAHLPVRRKLHAWLKEPPVVIEQRVVVEKQSADIPVHADVSPPSGAEEEVLEKLDANLIKQDSDSLASEHEVDAQLEELQKQYLTEAVQTSLSMEIDAAQIDEAQPEPSVDKDEETEIEEPVVEVTTQTEPSSFLDFISGTASTAGVSVKAAESDFERVDQILNTFINNERKEKAEFFNPERMARASIVDNEEIVTDTLATIYMNQGNYEKALRAYRSLQLKYPEKRVYFAARIEKAQSLLQKRNK